MERKTAGKILVVDDSELALAFARDALEAAGFEVVIRNIALGTAAAILREKPDLVLLDMSMPSMDGDELVHFIRNRESVRDTTIVLYSTTHAARLQEIALACGADGYHPKVSEPKKLALLVSQWIRKKRPVTVK